MLSEIENLDGDKTYIWLDYFELGRKNAQKLWGAYENQR